MELYKKNLGYFINCMFWIIVLSTNPIWGLIKYLGPIALGLPLIFGWSLATFEKDIDWEI